jgi:hypothetical protein
MADGLICSPVSKTKISSPGTIEAIERIEPEVVPSAEQSLLAPIPNSECKIAEESLRAHLTPFFISSQDQLTVGDRAWRRTVKTEGSDQFFPIINAGIGSDDKITTPVQKRLFLMKRFRRCPKHPMPQTDGPFAPYTRSV